MIEKAILAAGLALLLLATVPLVGAELAGTFNTVAGGFHGATLRVVDRDSHS